jgi:GR25 family glycosyltransferase involved in LPS biosynthesis
MKAYIIYLPKRDHSVAYATDMKKTLEKYDLEAFLFEGTDGSIADSIFEKEKRELYPYGIKSRDLRKEEIEKFLKDDLPVDFWETYGIKMNTKYKWSENELGKITRPGVKGCFHSHYRLWKHCVKLGEPIMIFEDDVKFYRGYLEVKFDEVLVLSLGKSSFLKDPWKTYLEDPTGNADVVDWRNYSMPGASGYAIMPKAASNLVKFYRHYYLPADNAINKSITKIQVHTYLMGRNTLPEEGNISMTKFRDWE